MHHFDILVIALAIDAAVGDPDWLWRRLPHPVAVAGQAIDWFDREFNQDAASDSRRRVLGMAAIIAVCIVLAIGGTFLEALLNALPLGWILVAVLVATLVAQRDLYDHVAVVGRALADGDIDEARIAIGRIVGRDPGELDESGVAKAAIETLAENFSDAVVAPVFWFAVLGLPGILIYKFINTADSMVGHRSERYREFGWGAARADDLVNWIPARISAALITAAAFMLRRDAQEAWAAARFEARRHVSPNAGWPEAAMAGALGIALGGPRSYEGRVVEGAVLNEFGREEVGHGDIRDALTLFIVACLVHAAAYLLLGFALG